MVRKCVPRKLWDNSLKWVSETMSMTHTSSGGMDDSVPITRVTSETVDVSDYPDFGFYDKVWYRDNAGIGPIIPGRWLGITHSQRNLMCYDILNENVEVVSHSSVQRVKILELQSMDHSKTFNDFEDKIRIKLGEKTGHKMDQNRIQKIGLIILNQMKTFMTSLIEYLILKTLLKCMDDFTPEILADTYVNMELALTHDSEGSQYEKVTKRLRDANGLPIRTSDDNPNKNSRMYEVGYQYGYKALITVDTISLNMFAQVDEGENRHILFDQILDHQSDGT